MRTKDLIDLADNPEFISGIYNYCDRWCERCPFTSRCLVYAMENEETDDPAGSDIRNAEFWQKLGSIFQQAREMISAWAEENGVDLSAASLEPEIQEHHRKLRGAEDHELCVAAKDYAASVNEWFAEEILEVQGADDRVAADADESENDEMVNDATEVIHWYQYQIAAKTVRALMSRRNEEEENAEDLPKDSDGSIKVALIAIDRSISGWRLMQIARPNRAESVTPLLLALERLRQITEQTFPEARDFIRPGFDENPDDPVN
jgi:hypothetical protein